jgi:rubrerythrin
MDLIDRETLVEELNKLYGEQTVSKYSYSRDCKQTRLGIALAINKVKTAPTVEPVRHGKWIYLFSNSTGNVYRCSNCTKWYNPNQDDVRGFRIEEKPDYCPHCGAKMED